MVNAQEWLDKYYPKDKQIGATKLYTTDQGLTGSLDLSNFKNLTELEYSGNQLTNLDFLLTIPHPEKLTYLFLSNNEIVGDLTPFSKFVGLEILRIGNDDEERIKQGIYNRWTGSLEPLKNLTKLKELCIEGTDIDSGLEYLPDSLNEAQYDTDTGSPEKGRVYCSPKKIPGSKVAAIKEQLKPFGYNLGKWKENYRKRLEREQEGNFTKNQLVLTEK